MFTCNAYVMFLHFHVNKRLETESDMHSMAQAILCRQSDVLQRLEELDKEAEGLRRELAETTSTRSQLASRVEELQTECSSLHAQVAEYEVKIYHKIQCPMSDTLVYTILIQSNSAAAAKEQQCLREELTHLELQLASLSSELEAEKQKCRLLVDYPDNCSTRALSGCESQKHISANTIRILLLEEQNSELREVMLRHARQTHGKRKTEVSGLHVHVHACMTVHMQKIL